MAEFAHNLARLRTEKGITQEELAKRAGVTQAAIWQYEKGLATPKVQIAVRLANILGTTCEELIQNGGAE